MRMTALSGLTFGLAAAVSMGAHATPIEISTGDGNGAAAHVRSNDTGDATATVQVRNAGTEDPGNFSRKGYFRHDLSALPFNVSAITEATVSFMYAGLFDAEGDTYTFDVYGLNDTDLATEDWDENAVTWTSAPGNDTGSGSLMDENETTFLGQFTANDDDIGEFITIGNDPTEQQNLVSFLQGDTNGLVTFVVTQAADDAGFDVPRFGSHRSGTFEGPVLSVVPEPGSLALLGMASLLCLGRRRRSVEA